MYELIKKIKNFQIGFLIENRNEQNKIRLFERMCACGYLMGNKNHFWIPAFERYELNVNVNDAFLLFSIPWITH